MPMNTSGHTKTGFLLGVVCSILWPVSAMGAPLSLSPASDEADVRQGKPATHVEAPAQPQENNRLKLHVEHQGVPRAIMFRQLQPQRYARFEQKTRSLKQSLFSALSYLESLQSEPPDLQRLSAFSAEAWLDWADVEKQVTPDERQFESYQLMRAATIELRALTNYWITVERLRRSYRSSLREAQLDNTLLKSKREKIQESLQALRELDQLKSDLKSEIPY